jgi:DNA-binding CsgD family transcriptional regulator
MPVVTMRRKRGRPGVGNDLTAAERATLDLLRTGLSNAEIALRRGVSVNTVRTQVSSMLSKLGLANRKALARWEGLMTSTTKKLECSFCGRTRTKWNCSSQGRRCTSAVSASRSATTSSRGRGARRGSRALCCQRRANAPMPTRFRYNSSHGRQRPYRNPPRRAAPHR